MVIVLGLEFRTLHLLNRCSTSWTTSPTLFAFGYFSDKVCCFFARLTLNHSPSTYASHVTGITEVRHHDWLTCWNGVLLTFFPRLVLNCNSSPSVSPKWLGLEVWATAHWFLLFATKFLVAMGSHPNRWSALGFPSPLLPSHLVLFMWLVLLFSSSVSS
jgi:hypothetical protein